MERRVLITGFRGFTGRYMAAELASNGYEVFGLGSQPGNEANYHQVDMLDLEGLRSVISHVKPSFVVHLAGLTFVGNGDANSFYRINLIGTRNLLEAVSISGVSLDAVLLVSSANVYGNASTRAITECTTPVPANDYAVSKLAMEYMASLWHERLPIVIARPFNYTGVGQAENFLLPKIVSHFRRKSATIELGNLDVWRDFSDVRAVVQAYRGLLEVKPVGQIFNVCSGHAHSLREVMGMCQSITGLDMQIEVNPAFVRASEVKTLCGDASRLRSLLCSWQTPPLVDTLRWMLTAD